ncbi:MAG TPA: hypothetical protein VJC17_03390 [Candidatus Dojkabacteria bacterium]|nr:hypothetical protein [Candidatus Dojkabacteria bacterium]
MEKNPPDLGSSNYGVSSLVFFYHYFYHNLFSFYREILENAAGYCQFIFQWLTLKYFD